MKIAARLIIAALWLGLLPATAHATGILEAQVVRQQVETDRGDTIILEYSLDTDVVTFLIETRESSFRTDTTLMAGLEGPDLQRMLHYHYRDPDADTTVRMLIVPFYRFGAARDVSVLLEFDDAGFRRLAVVREGRFEDVLAEHDF